MTELRIEHADATRIPELEPIWASLQEHHAALDRVPAVRAVDASWARRRAQYERWLGGSGAHLLIASDARGPVGYLMLRLGDGPSTWEVGDRAGEVETLAVLPAARSEGVGEALMKAAIAVAEASGVNALGVGVAHSNTDAIRFYERVGFKHFYVEMLRVSE